MTVYQAVYDNGRTEWYVVFIDLPNCVGGGDTPEEAIEDARATKKVYLKEYKKDGIANPNPCDLFTLTSGKIALRVPLTTHNQLLTRARIEGVSLNSYINATISEKLGRDSAITAFRKTVAEFLNCSGMDVSS